MFAAVIRDIKIDYDIEKKDVKSIQLVYRTTVQKILKAIKVTFEILWELKIGIVAGALAGIAVSQVLMTSLIFSSATGAALGAVAWLVIKALRSPAPPSSDGRVALPAKIHKNLLSLDQARRVNQVFLKILETQWGKCWQEAKALKLDEAFKNEYLGLLKGTCLGQTHTLIKLMATHHAKGAEELLKGLTFDEIIRYQFTHDMRVDLCNWRNRDFYKKGFCLWEQDLVKHHNKINEVNQAQIDAMREEFALPGAVRKENLILTDNLGDKREMQNRLSKSLQDLEKANPGKIIAGTFAMDFKKGSSHAFFVQGNGGHYRIYDINYGMYQFSDQNRLAAGLVKHLQRYSMDGIAKAGLEPFAINPA